MEKLINICLNSRIDGLSVQNEIMAQRSSRVAGVLWVLEETENALYLTDNILLVINLIRIYRHQLRTEVLYVKKLLEQRVYVTCSSKIFKSSETFVDALDRLNLPIVLFPPWSFGHHGDEKLIEFIVVFGLKVDHFQKLESKFSQLLRLEPPESDVLWMEKALIEQVHKETLLALCQDVFKPVDFNQLINAGQVT